MMLACHAKGSVKIMVHLQILQNRRALESHH